jgi:hypothetical protein
MPELTPEPDSTDGENQKKKNMKKKKIRSCIVFYNFST